MFSGLSEYSGLPVSVVSFPVSELRGKSLGSEDSTRSVDTTSEDLSFLSHLESIHEFPVIQAFVRQNKKQEAKCTAQPSTTTNRGTILLLVILNVLSTRNNTVVN